MKLSTEQLTVFDSVAELQKAAAERAASILRASQDGTRVHVALAGGSTPRPCYEKLAQRTDIDWAHVEIWFGDERTVGPEHADSNFRMAAEALLDHVPIPEQNIHRMLGERDPVEAADAYESELRSRVTNNDGTPQLDLVLLGMGDDGHTASLFPGTSALDVSGRLVVANEVPQLGTTRLTLTYTALNAARQVLFLVAGESKASALKQIVGNSSTPLPAALVLPKHGGLSWLVDRSAASLLRDG